MRWRIPLGELIVLPLAGFGVEEGGLGLEGRGRRGRGERGKGRNGSGPDQYDTIR